MSAILALGLWLGQAPPGRADMAQAFMQPDPDLVGARDLDFILGQAIFEKLWVSAPASTKASDGLGPLFNARACRSCHVANGRAHAPDGPDDRRPGYVLRLLTPDGQGDPVYGQQIQDRAIAGHAAEARLTLTYADTPVTLSDGTIIPLRQPQVGLADLSRGPIADRTRLTARVAPQMIGLGLLALIPADALIAAADPDDLDGDGISGRVHWVDTPAGSMPGRFGHKAHLPSIRAQTVQAFAEDMGLSTPDRPAGWGDCTAAQTDCRAAPDGNSAIHDGVEVSETTLAVTSFYAASLAVPDRRDPENPKVTRGETLFHSAGCASCHTPTQPTENGRVIQPYTDLLLHDLGPDLADPLLTGQAAGAEWRTAPLWGIGLTKTVTGRQSFLHDGRARTLLEAILWHGGEARSAREAVTRMTDPDRDALITFLESL